MRVVHDSHSCAKSIRMPFRVLGISLPVYTDTKKKHSRNERAKKRIFSRRNAYENFNSRMRREQKKNAQVLYNNKGA